MRKVSPALPREISDGYLIAAIIQSDDVVALIQREIGLVHPDLALRPEQVRAILRSTVLQDTLLDNADMLVATAQLADHEKAPEVPATGKNRATGSHPAVKRQSRSSNGHELTEELRHDKVNAGHGG